MAHHHKIHRPTTVIPVGFVGSTKASFPSTGTGGFELTITIPVPSAVEDGHALIAALATSYNDTDTWSTPGWSQLDLGDLIILARTANAEPASYTWTSTNLISGAGRSAVMLAFSNVATIGDSAHGDLVLTVPDLTNVKEGSALVAFVKGRSTITAERWAADAPLTLAKNHVGACILAYCLNTHLGSGYELNLTPGVVSGRSFSWTGGGSPSVPEVYGAILEPA